MIYVAILIIAIVTFFDYKPIDKKMQIPKDFKEDNSYFREYETNIIT